MSDVKKIATREAYGKTLAELGAEMQGLVVLDCDLAGATKTSEFRKVYPDRHIDCGIAESNMMSIAAGLAAAGMVPFASTFAMFAAGRAFEQIRNSIGYPQSARHTPASVSVRTARLTSVWKTLLLCARSPEWWSCVPRMPQRQEKPSGQLQSMKARSISVWDALRCR